MSTSHAKQAEAYLQNDAVATRHDATFYGVRQKRDKMAQALPEWEQLRDAASQIKKHTVTHLADYLEQFAARAEANGVHIMPSSWISSRRMA
jgi:L-lactate dehydrogenase complex protein LldF